LGKKKLRLRGVSQLMVPDDKPAEDMDGPVWVDLGKPKQTGLHLGKYGPGFGDLVGLFQNPTLDHHSLQVTIATLAKGGISQLDRLMGEIESMRQGLRSLL
jgi:hypothetical protein